MCNVDTTETKFRHDIPTYTKCRQAKETIGALDNNVRLHFSSGIALDFARKAKRTAGSMRVPPRANSDFAFRFGICEEEQQTNCRNGSANKLSSLLAHLEVPSQLAKASLHLTWNFAKARTSAPFSQRADKSNFKISFDSITYVGTLVL